MNDKAVNGTLIFDFTSNNLGENVYSEGYIPDGIPVRVNNGTQNITIYTNKGKTNYILPNLANLMVYVDFWSKYIVFSELVVSNNINGGWHNASSKVINLTSNYNTIYYKINNGEWISNYNSVILSLDKGVYEIQYYAQDAFGNSGDIYAVIYYIHPNPPSVNVTLPEGWYNSSVSFYIITSDNSTLYYCYKNNNWTNTTEALIKFDRGTFELRFFTKDIFGNVLLKTLTYYIDKEIPWASYNLTEGDYLGSQTIFINASDNLDPNPIIYYKINNETLQNSTKNVTINLEDGEYEIYYYVVDKAGNIGYSKTLNYFIVNSTTYQDISNNLYNGIYNSSQMLILNLTDETNDFNIYYSVNGGSFVNGGRIVVLNLTDGIYFINYTAINFEGVEIPYKTLFVIINETENLVLSGSVINWNRGKFYNSIQGAIDDVSTVDGDVIQILPGVYTENIILNKSILLQGSGYNKTSILAYNDSLPIIKVNIDNVIIYDLTFIGTEGIFLNNSSYSIISSNVFTCEKSIYNCEEFVSYDNWIVNNEINGGIWIYNAHNYIINKNSISGTFGLMLNNVNGFFVSNNTLKSFLGNGIYNSFNIIIENNHMFNSSNGIYMYNVINTTIKENYVKNNRYGIFLENVSNGNVSFNYMDNLIDFSIGFSNNVTANNNWWSTNTPNYIVTNPYDIIDFHVNVNFLENMMQDLINSWLVLSLEASSYKVLNGGIYEAVITADLNHDNWGNDVSFLGCVPDVGEIFFRTEYGTITNNSTFINGMASAVLILNRSILGNLNKNLGGNIEIFNNVSGNVTFVQAILSDCVVYNYVKENATIDVYVISNAIDMANNKTLNISYNTPLNKSTSWITVLWRNTGIYTSTVDIIYDGIVVQTYNITNSAYLQYKNQYSDDVFKIIALFNTVLIEYDGNTYQYNTNLNYLINSLPGFKYLSKKDKLTVCVNAYNDTFCNGNLVLTVSDLNFIYSNHDRFIDQIFCSINYFGDTVQISHIDTLNDTIFLNFPDSSLKGGRISNIYYVNGDNTPRESDNVYSAGYEGLRSYVIATTNVTDNDLIYWASLNETIPIGPMKAAYGTFLEALMVIYCHDRVADKAATQFNVTWNRTTPVMISYTNDFDRLYGSGESDHRFGMDVYGDEKNIWLFNFACSYGFSLVEQLTGAYGNFSENDGVIIGILRAISKGDQLEMIYSNGQLIIKAASDNNNILIIDLETGLVRDIGLSGGISGNPCYHFDTTDGVLNALFALLNPESYFNLNLNNVWDKIYNLADSLGENPYADFFMRLGADVAGGFILGAGVGIIVGSEGLGMVPGLGLSGIGVGMIYYGNGLDKEPDNPYNWFGFSISLALSVTPQTNLMKIPIKIASNPKIVKGILLYTDVVITTGISAGISITMDGLERFFDPKKVW